MCDDDREDLHRFMLVKISEKACLDHTGIG